MSNNKVNNHEYYMERQWNYFKKRLETLKVRKWIFLGDSIYNIWNIESIFDGINFGISGESFNGCLKHIDFIKEIKGHNIFLHFGINDIHTPIDTLKEITTKVVTEISQNNKIYLSEVLHVNESIYKEHWGFEIKNSKIIEFNKFLESLCNENIIYCNSNKYLLKNNELNQEYTFDGLHLNQIGYSYLEKAYLETIKQNKFKIKIRLVKIINNENVWKKYILGIPYAIASYIILLLIYYKYDKFKARRKMGLM